MTIKSSQLRIPGKNPVLVATTSNVSLSGGAPQTVDDVGLAVGDRILVWKQTSAAENGIYKVQTLGTGSNGTWVRTKFFSRQRKMKHKDYRKRISKLQIYLL
mgnify:CR=1 FL=1